MKLTEVFFRDCTKNRTEFEQTGKPYEAVFKTRGKQSIVGPVQVLLDGRLRYVSEAGAQMENLLFYHCSRQGRRFQAKVAAACPAASDSPATVQP